MKKFVQSFWGRFLVVLLCTITVMTGIASGLLTIALATMGNKEQYYKNRQQDIAENYAAYLYDQIYRGEENIDKTIARIENFLNDKNFTCSIGKVIGGDTGAEVLLYNNLEVASEWDYEIDFTSDSYVCYNVENALDAIRTNPYMEHGFAITDGIIEEYVFEEETGLFYYKSGTHYFLADYIVVSKDGENYDYSLKNTEDGKKVYCNSYYGITLDTMDYRAWDWVKMGDQKLLMNLDDLKAVNEIEIITDSSIQTKVYTGVYYECVGNYISYYKERTADIYVIRMNVEDDFSHIATVSDDMFYEWKVLWDDFLANETSYKVFLILSVLGFLLGMALLIYSANSDKEHIGFLQKVPVGIFTLFIALVEIPLSIVLLDVVFDGFYGSYVVSFDLWVMIAGVTIFSMAFFAFIWLQNIIARFKCRSFLRYSEFYYGRKFLKWCWAKWKLLWNKIITPFRVIMELIRDNTKLFTRGLVIMLGISFVEFLFIIWFRQAIDIFMMFFMLEKVVELVVITFVLLQMQKLQDGSKRIAAGDLSNPIDTKKMIWEFKKHGENINKVSEGIAFAVEERMKSERFKTELITNVSHDIKTPLTSIINYVDLIKKQDVQDETLQEYVEVLDRQSARLKKLIEDLMEASKASTGNMAVHMEECDIEVLLTQLIGEFEEKLSVNQLEVVVQKPNHPVMMFMDGRHMWRVLDNLLNNVCKYSLSGTRVYISLVQTKEETTITFKNISKAALNIASDELMERFVRGDSSRNTEGSGLGLSIAQSLTELMNGSMNLEIDGDLFKVTLRFKTTNKNV